MNLLKEMLELTNGLSANRKFLIAVFIGIVLAIISFLLWRVDQTISLIVLVVAMAIPIGVYAMFEDLVDLEDLLDQQVETHEEEYVEAVKVPAAPLSDLPIETIEGIGESYGKMLRNGGIDTVADMIAADPIRIKELTGVTTRKAERWIAMSRFAWLDSVSEEDAEAIVFATSIRQVKELANADPSDLLSKIKKAVADGKVEVPADYEFTLEMAKAWVNEAKQRI